MINRRVIAFFFFVIAIATTKVMAMTCTDLDGARVYSQETSPKYLGFFGDALAPDSIMNTYGTYGSSYNLSSVRNTFGSYGSTYGPFSANNSYSTTPPIIMKWGEVIGYLSTNNYIGSRVSLSQIDSVCTFYKFNSSWLPSFPLGVSATDGLFAEGVILSWLAVNEATGYLIYRSTTLNGPKIPMGYSLNTAVTFTGLLPKTKYYFWVYSYNSAGPSTLAGVDTGFVRRQTIPPDFDNDSDSDVLVQRKKDGYLYSMEMQSNNDVALRRIRRLNLDSFSILGTGDFDNDGDSDVLVQRKRDGYLYSMEMQSNNDVALRPIRRLNPDSLQAITN